MGKYEIIKKIGFAVSATATVAYAVLNPSFGTLDAVLIIICLYIIWD